MEEKTVTVVMFKAIGHDFLLGESVKLADNIVGVYPGLLDLDEKREITRVIMEKFCNKHEVPVPRKFGQEKDDCFNFNCLGPVGLDDCKGVITFLKIETGGVVNV